MSDLADLVERQCNFILRREEPAQFLVEVPAFIHSLSREPRLATYIQDLRRDYDALASEYAVHDDALVADLVAIRNEFVEVAPEADDSDAEQEVDPAGFPRHEWDWTLANFDRIASDEASGRPQVEDPTRSGAMIGILHAKVENVRHPWERIEGTRERTVADQRPELKDLARRLGNLGRKHEHFLQSIRFRARTSPAVALLRLESIEEAINPAPAVIETDEDTRAYLEWAMRFALSPGRVLAKAVQGERLDRAGKDVLDNAITQHRTDVERLGEELRRLVGTTASRLALIHRFKHRAEWHDRDRLVEVAQKSGGKMEDRLTAELARFLFDQGLSPITRPLLGRLEPDLLDPSVRPSFYVEAKQYVDGANAKRNLVRAVAQVHDTVGTLCGSPFECREAFVVIFRRGGPRYSLPEALPGDGWTTHLVLVDIADIKEQGSRARKKPVQLHASDFLD